MVKVKLILKMVLNENVAAELLMGTVPAKGETISLTGPGSEAVKQRFGTRDFDVVSVQHEVELGEAASADAGGTTHTVNLYVKHHGSDSRISPEPRT